MKKHKVIRLILDFEKEEGWLNEMSAKGLHFISYSFPQYLFEEGVPGEYTYRLELLKHHPQHMESQAYIKFLEDTGVECVDTFWNWAYFRKKASDGPFEVYTDYASKIRHYQRIMAVVGASVVLNLGLGSYTAALAEGHFNPLLAIPSLIIAALLFPVLRSYLRRAKKLKDAMKLRE